MSGSSGDAGQRVDAIRRQVLGGDREPQEMEVYRPDTSVLDGAAANKTREPIAISASPPIRSHRRVLGWGIVPAKRVVRRFLKWLIEPLVDQINPLLNAFQGYFESHEQRLHLQREALLEDRCRLETCVAQLQALSARQGEEHARLSERLDRLAGIEACIAQLRDMSAQQAKGHDRVSELFDHLAAEVEHLRKQSGTDIGLLEERIVSLEEIKALERLSLLERSVKQPSRSATASPPDAGPDGATVGVGRPPRVPDSAAFLLHERLRGSETLVYRRQEQYLDLFSDRGKVLDIGCGRGEFLQIMREHGVDGYGVETNAAFVDGCRERGLDVRLEEATSHLRRLASGSLGGIFCAQVVEHLGAADLMQLLQQSFERLAAGGVFVAETLNPESIAFLRYFYQDPSHVRPYPAATLEVLLQSVGFANVRVRFMTPVAGAEKLVALPVPAGFHHMLEQQYLQQNRNITLLNERLFGPVEYAIVAEKPGGVPAGGVDGLSP